MGIKRYRQLFNGTTVDAVSASATGSWIRLDNRYSDLEVRPINITVSGGDSIAIQVTVVDQKSIDETYLNNLTANQIVTLQSLTATGQFLLEGGYTWVRAVKTGTAAYGLVEGFI